MTTKKQGSAPAHPNRAVIYCRVSSAGQEDNSSLDTQEQRCRDNAAERGWVAVGVFREVHTGAELFERPQLCQLRAMLRAGEADIVLAYALDRVSRNQAHLGFLLSEWDHHGVRLELVTEAFDETPEGRLLQSVRGFVAEMERLKIAERTTRGRRARIDQGRLLPGPRPPYGYHWVDERKTWLAEDPRTAPVIRRIFAEIAAGSSARKLAQRLTVDGVPTPTGLKVWCGSTITKIIKHPVYIGEATALRGRRERVSGGTTKSRQRPTALEERVVLADIAPALVSQESAAVARARLTANKAEAGRNNHDPQAALLRAGIARCGYCGNALTVNNGAKGGPAYKCGTTARDRYGCPYFGIKTATLDVAVWSRVEAVLLRPEIVGAEVARLRREDPTSENITAIERRMAEVIRRQRNLITRLADIEDGDVAALIQADLNTLAVEKRCLDQERASLDRQREGWRLAQENLDSIEAWCRTVAANLGGLTYDQRRTALSALGVEARLWGRDHHPRYEIVMALDIVKPSSSRRVTAGFTCASV